MPFPFLPTWQADNVTQITPDFLKAQGIRLLMLDFDNTLLPYTTNTPEGEILSWLEGMKSAGFEVCIVSNSKKNRVPEFCRTYGIDCITHAKKPSAKAIRRCLSQYGIPAREAVLVGDQIYTDTLGGGCAGVRTILVKAIHNHNIWLKLRHIAEMPFIFAAKKRRI